VSGIGCAGVDVVEPKYIFVSSMDVDPDKEALFNEVYDTQHIFEIF
jgi:hypothetical protein